MVAELLLQVIVPVVFALALGAPALTVTFVVAVLVQLFAGSVAVTV
jgi:hypothetical protein